MREKQKENARAISLELDWLRQIIYSRLQLFFKHESSYDSVLDIACPELPVGSTYAEFVEENQLGFEERLILSLAIAPHVKPELMDGFYTRNSTYDKTFTEFGGIFGKNNTFFPTIETVFFLLAEGDYQRRFDLQFSFFDAEHIFIRKKVLYFQNAKDQESFWSIPLSISSDYIDLFTLGEMRKPDFSASFPARCIETEMEWSDLVLSDFVKQEVLEIKDWIDHSHKILYDWEMAKKISKGYKALFYGPPGTGKTLTASLLGKSTGRQVYKIDLSLVVSKYIGETEKNLAKIFDKAIYRNWILFFDEADALFGKRTETKESNDRYANQEVAYLLQRLEEFDGIAIMATNIKDNIDKAFTRRFHSMIHFPMPSVNERCTIWEKAFSPHIQLDKKIDLLELSNRFKLSGALIMNVVRQATVKAAKKEKPEIDLNDIEKAIRKELHKEEITILR